MRCEVNIKTTNSFGGRTRGPGHVAPIFNGAKERRKSIFRKLCIMSRQKAKILDFALRHYSINRLGSGYSSENAPKATFIPAAEASRARLRDYQLHPPLAKLLYNSCSTIFNWICSLHLATSNCIDKSKA